jgi:cobaltochelatase CobN
VIHVGKHGNLEWLPGKGVGLSQHCWPDALLGPLPNIYPFIVNDPGEGAQAKRRTQAVIIDHLMPPLTRAETYGPLRDLELLADEYYEAQLLDPRVPGAAARHPQAGARTHRPELNWTADATPVWLPRLDTYLCDLEGIADPRWPARVRRVAPGPLAHRHLAGAAAHSRGDGRGRNRACCALAKAFELGFDPLDCALAEPWTGPRPWRCRRSMSSCGAPPAIPASASNCTPRG